MLLHVLVLRGGHVHETCPTNSSEDRATYIAPVASYVSLPWNTFYPDPSFPRSTSDQKRTFFQRPLTCCSSELPHGGCNSVYLSAHLRKRIHLLLMPFLSL
jgi:hypothetical protein